MASKSQPQYIEQLLMEDRLDEAFGKAVSVVEQLDETLTEFVLQKGRLEDIKLKEGLQLLQNDDVNLEKNKVRFGFLQTLKKLKSLLEDNFRFSPPSEYNRSYHNEAELGEALLKDLLLGKYKNLSALAVVGTSGIHFLAEEELTGRKVFIKLVKYRPIDDSFREEMKRLGSLKHRNVIKLIEEHLQIFPFYIVTEHVNGPKLDDVIKKTGPLPWWLVISLGCQMADLLDYLRQKKINHSSIRLSKIFLDEEFKVMLSPFDIFKSGSNNRNLEKFREDLVCFSPEQLNETLDESNQDQLEYSDQYSLGLLLYELLTGRPLFQGQSIPDMIKKRELFYQKPKGFFDFPPQAPKLLLRVIEKLLAHTPSGRFDDLRTVHNELMQVRHSTNHLLNPLENSYRRALRYNRNLMRSFYENLFKKVEGLEGRFANPDRQRLMLQLAINVILELDTRRPYFTQLLLHPAHKGLDAPQFKLFIEILLETICSYDKRIDDEVSKAWKEVQHQINAALDESIKPS